MPVGDISLYYENASWRSSCNNQQATVAAWQLLQPIRPLGRKGIISCSECSCISSKWQMLKSNLLDNLVIMFLLDFFIVSDKSLMIASLHNMG